MSALHVCWFCKVTTLCFWRREHHICVECVLAHRDEAA